MYIFLPLQLSFQLSFSFPVPPLSPALCVEDRDAWCCCRDSSLGCSQCDTVESYSLPSFQNEQLERMTNSGVGRETEKERK